jgi:hypothetical protein
MKLSEKIVTVLVGLGIFFLGYLVLLILCNYMLSTTK